MTDKILHFTGLTTVDLPPEKVLEEAKGANLSKVVVIGDQDGEIYVAASDGSVAVNYFLLQKAANFLMDLTGEFKGS